MAHPLAQAYGWEFYHIIYELEVGIVNRLLPMALRSAHHERQFQASLHDKELPDRVFGDEDTGGLSPKEHSRQMAQWQKMKQMMAERRRR